MPRKKKCLGLYLIMLLLAILATGCVKVGPDFVRPEAPVAEKWLESDDKRVKMDSAEHREWWRVFKDPLLDRLVNKAYEDNLTLQIAGVRVLEARAQLGVATGNLYPQTQQFTGAVEKDRTSAHAPLVVPKQALGYFQSSLLLGASWEIDFWGKFRRAIESADAGLLASIADYDNALVSLIGDVANAYINIRTFEKRLEIARQNVKVQRESLQIADARFVGGTTSQRDVEQANTVLFNTEASIPSLESQLRQAKNALCVLLGLPPNPLQELLKGTADIPSPGPQVAVGIPVDLLRRRPDIRSAEFKAAAQCAKIGVAKADLFPAFSLTGNFGFLAGDTGQSNLSQMFFWRSRTGLFNPTLTWNIFNYGQITNNVRVQDAQFEALILSYKNTVLTAQKEVEDALIAFLKSQERAQFLAESAAAAQRSLDLAIIQYREGMTDFTTVLTAQQNLLSEQDSLATTLGTIANSLVGVYKALGGGWQIRDGQDFIPDNIKDAMAKRTNWGKLLAPASHTPKETDKPKLLIRPPDW